MPSYDYHCESNGRTVEVKHGMNELLATWGELCGRAGIEPGDTPENAPVQRLISGGQYVRSSSLGDAVPPACGAGGCQRCSFE